MEDWSILSNCSLLNYLASNLIPDFILTYDSRKKLNLLWSLHSFVSRYFMDSRKLIRFFGWKLVKTAQSSNVSFIDFQLIIYHWIHFMPFKLLSIWSYTHPQMLNPVLHASPVGRQWEDHEFQLSHNHEIF